MADFTMDEGQWIDAMVLNGSPNKPALATDYYDCVNDMTGSPAEAELRPRSAAHG